MAMGFIRGQMEGGMKGDIYMIKKKDGVDTYGVMAEYMRASGCVVSSME
jgi:hypothetical protein